MNQDRREFQDFAGMPEDIYEDLLKKSRQVSLETALSVEEHRKLVQRERAERRNTGSAMPMGM